MSIYSVLKRLEEEKKPIRVALVGCGKMGKGIALQMKVTPGLQLVSVTDRNKESAYEAARLNGENLYVSEDIIPILRNLQVDVLVEATGTVEYAAKVCVEAMENKIHVVLMNAEVDLLLGPYLHEVAKENGVIITSDAGDQHGVLARMVEEIKMWGFQIVMIGNIKGFLNKYAMKKEMIEEARKRNLDVNECVFLTDGTKLNIEMSLLANAYGCKPSCRGMEGPKCDRIEDVFKVFDIKKFSTKGIVDYVLGAEPSGGVFVIGYTLDEIQKVYLKYYKRGDGPFYLFYRPYHLCHLETPRAIVNAAIFHQKILEPKFGKLTEVYAFAKRDLKKGEEVEGAGGNHFFGMIDCRDKVKDLVPILMLERENEEQKIVMVNDLEKDQPLTWKHVYIPIDTDLFKMYRFQNVRCE